MTADADADTGHPNLSNSPPNAYRLTIHHTPDGVDTVAVEVDIDTKQGWVTADTWTSRTRPADAQDHDDPLTTQSTTRGWTIVGPPVSISPAITHVPVTPADWHAVLLAATRHRAELQEAATAADLAWQALVSRTPRSQVGAIEIADMAGLGRHRIYQIQGVGAKPGRFPPT